MLPAPTPSPVSAPAPVIQAEATKPTIQQTITKWANYYGVAPNWLIKIARCESTFNPLSVNYRYTAYNAKGVSMGHPVGLFQHVEGYWPARAARYGVPGASIYDVDAQARVTAGMFRDGESNLWECK